MRARARFRQKREFERDEFANDKSVISRKARFWGERDFPYYEKFANDESAISKRAQFRGERNFEASAISSIASSPTTRAQLRVRWRQERNSESLTTTSLPTTRAQRQEFDNDDNNKSSPTTPTTSNHVSSGSARIPIRLTSRRGQFLAAWKLLEEFRQVRKRYSKK